MIGSSIIFSVFASLSLGQDTVQNAQSAPTRVDDIEVTAQATRDAARTFVGRVAAPARGGGLGRWTRICPGVANLSPDSAQSIIDRIADMAFDLGIEVQDPGCEANIVIVFAADATTTTQTLVARDPDVFRHGGNGIDRGTAALQDFQTSDRPVRWWSLSVPIDGETGLRAVRVPGDAGGRPVSARVAAALGCKRHDCPVVPVINSTAASRLTSQIEHHLYKSIIVVDADAVAGLNTQQLGDYLALVSLAQIDPEAETGAFDTVLNLFEAPTAVDGLSDWDRSYLSALYGSPSRRSSVGAQGDAVAAIMVQDAARAAEE